MLQTEQNVLGTDRPRLELFRRNPCRSNLKYEFGARQLAAAQFARFENPGAISYYYGLRVLIVTVKNAAQLLDPMNLYE